MLIWLIWLGPGTAEQQPGQSRLGNGPSLRVAMWRNIAQCRGRRNQAVKHRSRMHTSELHGSSEACSASCLSLLLLTLRRMIAHSGAPPTTKATYYWLLDAR